MQYQYEFISIRFKIDLQRKFTFILHSGSIMDTQRDFVKRNVSLVSSYMLVDLLRVCKVHAVPSFVVLQQSKLHRAAQLWC